MGVPTLSRVVWSEGMHLAQHHFQAQSRYFESAIHFALSSVFPGLYGLLSLELDDDALWNGTASVVGASGVMPDGLPFDLGDTEPVPPKRPVAELLRAGAEAQILHLAIAEFKRRRSNCDLDPGADSGFGGRFRAQQVDLFDETTGTDERPVSLGLKNFRLISDEELDDDLVTLPIARIQADGTGHFIYDPAFVPPCLHIAGSVRLMSMLRRLVEIMDAKAASLGRLKSTQGYGLAEMASHELTTYWLTHALYSSLGSLKHLAESGRAHPRELYQELIRLAGALCTFSMAATVDDIPSYDHRNPTDVFARLERLVRDNLDVVISESYLSVPLPQTGAHVYAAPLEDQRAFDRAEWLLRVSSSAPASTVIADVPRKVKICSAEDVMKLVADANPGLPLEHLPVPPAKVAARVGSHYFKIRTEGKAWQVVSARSTVGVYVPDSLPGAEVELLVVLA